MTAAEMEDTLTEIAADIVVPGMSIEDAVVQMTRKLNRSPKLKASLRAQAFEWAIRLAVHRSRAALHRQARKMPGRANRSPVAMEIVSEIGWTSILDNITLPDGTLLGDANRQQVLEMAQDHEASADGHRRMATFYTTLAQETTGGMKIRECVTGARADQLWDTLSQSTSDDQKNAAVA